MGKLNWVLAVITLVFILFSSDFNCEVEVVVEGFHVGGECNDYSYCDYDDDKCYHVYQYGHTGSIKWSGGDECYPLCSGKVNSTFGGTEGHYTTHIGTATNDPCTLPGPEGANYYFKWNHGMPSGGLELPTPESFFATRDDCLESVIVNKLGYYLWVPRNSDQEGKCVSPSGDYVWYYGQLPKEKQTDHYVASPTPTLRDFVYPENNVTMMSILGLTPPPDEAYTERPEPVTVSPQQEEEQMIIPAPQATEATVAPIQAPEVVTTAPIQTHPYIPAPSYYPPSYLPPGTMSVPKTVNIFL